MLNEKKLRELAYVVRIDSIEPIAGKDRVECARVGGWTVMVKKGEFKPGDLAIYFEIDSRLPQKPEYEFTAKYNYKIKTQKFKTPDGAFYSQGLIMPFDEVGLKAEDCPAGTFLTEKLGVTYATDSDNERKAKPADKYKRMAQLYPEVFKKKFVKWLYKFTLGKKILFIFFGKKTKKTAWPDYVQVTDEERVQNCPGLPSTEEFWIGTEKLDGSSTTFTCKRKGKKYNFLVCSRHVVFDKPDKKCFYETNIYTEMAEKYNMESVLKDYLMKHPEAEWVTLQGETYGAGVQRKDYGMTDHDFSGFNLIDSWRGRYNSIEAARIMAQYGIKWVPVLGEFDLREKSVDEILAMADGNSVLDGEMREGIVFRSIDGKKSFKAVSNPFLVKYHS